MISSIVGYASSGVLVLTIGGQLSKQWRSGTSKGVSPFLFAGQLLASCGFTLYSALVQDMVFVATNACVGVAAGVGLGIVLYHRRNEGHGVESGEVP